MTDPSVQPADLSAFLRTRAALLAAWAWLKGKPVATSVGVVAALLLSMFVGLPIEWPIDTTVQPVAAEAEKTTASPLDLLSGRLDALEAQEPTATLRAMNELTARVALLEAQPRPTVARRTTSALGLSLPDRTAVDVNSSRRAGDAETPQPQPITRQSIDQFRASLRTTQPQE